MQCHNQFQVEDCQVSIKINSIIKHLIDIDQGTIHVWDGSSKAMHAHTFGFVDDVDPFWLCGDDVLSEAESLAIGLHGGEDIGISDRFGQGAFVSQVLLNICLDVTGTICLGVEGIFFWILFGGIIVRLFGFLQPYYIEKSNYLPCYIQPFICF